ncbi:hypothetical protein EDS67_20775 [candidate division KSB1 bacterium]|nr:MAG: hypothetical protein EDS67_20775 [candidate division KSB1 bacterium]MBC6950372.1 hypothetical protein [candidate division KSB1 bacterium]MCE7943816.1 hypothetical protein [Chlorobi bacterium CHB1]MDL1876912.1 hypothetical protein [Cytophagia bacterium CHB2]
MAIDKELYRKMLEAYREWNEFELADRARNAGRLSPEEAWQQYVDLWEFAVNSAPTQSDLRLKLRLQEWEEYYAKIEKFEAWRRTRTQKTQGAFA